MREGPARQKAFEAWVTSHSPSAIRDANNARLYLRRLGVGRGTTIIQDPRRVKMPTAAFPRYLKDQYSSGREFPKTPEGKTSVAFVTEILRDEFKALGPEERKVCCVLFFSLGPSLLSLARWLMDVCRNTKTLRRRIARGTTSRRSRRNKRCDASGEALWRLCSSGMEGITVVSWHRDFSYLAVCSIEVWGGNRKNKNEQ